MTATPPYAIGQHVEVLTHNFSKPGMPKEWKHGVVTEVTPQDNGRHDVMVTTDDGIRHPQIVGVRGGGKNLRAAPEAAQATPTAGLDAERVNALSMAELQSELQARGIPTPRAEVGVMRSQLKAALRTEGRVTPAAGPVPKVTGYAKGRELEPGMLVNAADLLPMHESQGNTTGENPNPLGHANWVRVGLIGNTNNPAYRSYNSNRSLTGGMYVIFDQSGHPVGRMSANTIAEINTEDVKPEAALQQLRVPIKVQVQVKNPRTGEVTIEERDAFDMALVPSKHAQREAGMPAPKMLSEGIVDPNDPHYGVRGRRPLPTNQPHGGFKQGSRTREQYRADREKRDQAYAASEPQRAARRAELEAARKADAAEKREQDRVAAEKQAAIRSEQYRRDNITRRHERIVEDLADAHPMVYDRSLNTTRPATQDEFAVHELTRGSSNLKALAEAYGVKTRGTTLEQQAEGIVAAVKAGKTPDLEVGAPKVLDESAQADADAKKIATLDKRRRTGIVKNLAEIRQDMASEFYGNRSGLPFHLEYLSDAQLEQLAAALGIFGLTGRTAMAAIVEAIKAGAEPNLDVNPITSLKKKTRR